MDDSQKQGKRKRVVTACDTCRKSKIKCDGEVPQCSRCGRIKINCVYTPVAKRNTPVKRTKLIEGLEDRLNRIESFVMSDLVFDSSDMKAGHRHKGVHSPYEPHEGSSVLTRSYPSRPATTPLHANNGSSRLGNETATPRSEISVLSTSTGEAKLMDFISADAKGRSQYFGSASGFSIFSPKGIAWINEKVGDAQFVSVISAVTCRDSSWDNPKMFADICSKRLHRRLPPKEETRALLREYFRYFKPVIALFHEQKFMSLFEMRFTQEYDSAHGPGWWASLNMVLAMTHRVRVMGDLTLQDEEELAWLYFKNSMAVLTELLLQGPNLLNLQALLAMAIYSQGTSNVELSCFLNSVAVRTSQNMGMHRESSGPELSPHDSQERRRLFWIAYMFDKNTSLRYGRPPNQDDNDMDIQLPGDEVSDGTSASMTVDDRFADTFRAMCRLAMIEGKVYRCLYSVQASKQSIEQIVSSVDQLDAELGNWRQSVPEDFRPESEIKILDDELRLQIVNFHLAYYHCLAAIHRKLVQHGHWVSRQDSPEDDGDREEIRKHVFSSAVLCVSAARASINLIRFIPQGSLVCIWIMLCYVVMSYLALCVNIYQNPEDPKAAIDLKLMKIVTNFLSSLRSDETDPAAHQLLEICGEFERLARRAVGNARAKQTSSLPDRRTPVPPPTSNDLTTRPSTSGTALTNGFLSDTDANLPGHSMPLESARYSSFRAPSSALQGQGSLLFNSEIATASPSLVTGEEEMDFTTGAVLPEYNEAASSSDFWQLPMPLEWNWTDMSSNYFLSME